MSDTLPFTGERFIPGVPGEIWYEHWHRYHFAAPMVAGRKVLDVACGAGYGSALLAKTATRVVGADISPAAIDHASERYASISNIEFRQADATALPFADGSFDVVVSFETIEHLEPQEAFLDEIRRVLRPGGLVIMSCPNKIEYTDKRGVINEFHVRELYRGEFAALLAPRFTYTAWYGQRPGFFSVVWPESAARGGAIFEIGEANADAPTQGHARPLYFIVVGSASAQALSAVEPIVSVLADRDEWVYRDYEKVTRSLDGAHRRGNALAETVEELTRHHAEAVRQRDALQAAASVQAADHAERLRLAADLATTREELARRTSLRWWLALPLRRLWNALNGRPPAS